MSSTTSKANIQEYKVGDYVQFQHLERIGTKNVEGILDGVCEIYPKLDGTNSSVWLDGETRVPKAGSRKRELTIEKDNAGFCKWVSGEKRFVEFFKEYPKHRLFGEWLVQHTIKTYKKDKLNRFYVFDVINEKGEYKKYTDYISKLERYEIDYVEIIEEMKDPTFDRLLEMAEKCDYFIKKGYGAGEGIVIKRKDYTNKAGRTNWAKLVIHEYKEKRKSGSEVMTTEEKIVDEFVTQAYIEKEYAKYTLDKKWEKKMFREFGFGLYDEFLREESYNFIIKYGKKTIDFSMLKGKVFVKIKKIIGM